MGGRFVSVSGMIHAIHAGHIWLLGLACLLLGGDAVIEDLSLFLSLICREAVQGAAGRRAGERAAAMTGCWIYCQGGLGLRPGGSSSMMSVVPGIQPLALGPRAFRETEFRPARKGYCLALWLGRGYISSLDARQVLSGHPHRQRGSVSRDKQKRSRLIRGSDRVVRRAGHDSGVAQSKVA